MGNYQETDVNPMEIERQFLITAMTPLPPAYDLLRQGYVALLRGLGRGYTVLRWHVRLGGSQALPAVPFYDKMEL